ncbi:MAG TPA: alpha/beta hydrolase [Firmicutes bacterium]|nr:alpha/beta hydrolase [Bacillota bacterium]
MLKIQRIGAMLPCETDVFEVSGARAFAFLPCSDVRKTPMPWVWYAPTFLDNNPGPENVPMFRRWLERGVAIAGIEVGESYGNPTGRAIFTAFHRHLTEKRDFARKVVLHPQSRGGLMLYNWAVEHPECIAASVGVYTVCDIRSYPGAETAAPAYGMTTEQFEAVLAEHNPIDRVAPLAAQNVPILHIHGDSDSLVPLEKNSAEFARRYRELGGSMEVIVVPGKGHEAIPEYFEREELMAFGEREAMRRFH